MYNNVGFLSARCFTTMNSSVANISSSRSSCGPVSDHALSRRVITTLKPYYGTYALNLKSHGDRRSAL